MQHAGNPQDVATDPVNVVKTARCHYPTVTIAFYLFINKYYVIFTQEYPVIGQHCSPWGSCIFSFQLQLGAGLPVDTISVCKYYEALNAALHNMSF